MLSKHILTFTVVMISDPQQPMPNLQMMSLHLHSMHVREKRQANIQLVLLKTERTALAVVFLVSCIFAMPLLKRVLLPSANMHVSNPSKKSLCQIKMESKNKAEELVLQVDYEPLSE